MVDHSTRQSFITYRPRPEETLLPKCDRLAREMRILVAAKRWIGLFVSMSQPSDPVKEIEGTDVHDHRKSFDQASQQSR